MDRQSAATAHLKRHSPNMFRVIGAGSKADPQIASPQVRILPGAPRFEHVFHIEVETQRSAQQCAGLLRVYRYMSAGGPTLPRTC